MTLAWRATVLLPEITARLISTTWPPTLRNASRSSICIPVIGCPSSRRSSKPPSSALLAPRIQQPDGPQIVSKCRGHRPPAPPPNYPARRHTHRNPTDGIHQRRQDLACVEREWKHPIAALRITVLVRSLPRQHHAST